MGQVEHALQDRSLGNEAGYRKPTWSIYRLCTKHTQTQRDKHFRQSVFYLVQALLRVKRKFENGVKPEMSLDFSLHCLRKKKINNNIQAFPIPKINLLIVLNI